MTIGITAIGYIVIPVTLLLLPRPRWLLGWALFLLVFQAAAAAVVRIGPRYPVGIAPAHTAAPLVVLSCLPALQPAERLPARLSAAQPS